MSNINKFILYLSSGYVGAYGSYFFFEDKQSSLEQCVLLIPLFIILIYTIYLVYFKNNKVDNYFKEASFSFIAGLICSAIIKTITLVI